MSPLASPSLNGTPLSFEASVAGKKSVPKMLGSYVPLSDKDIVLSYLNSHKEVREKFDLELEENEIFSDITEEVSEKDPQKRIFRIAIIDRQNNEPLGFAEIESHEFNDLLLEAQAEPVDAPEELAVPKMSYKANKTELDAVLTFIKANTHRVNVAANEEIAAIHQEEDGAIFITVVGPMNAKGEPLYVVGRDISPVQFKQFLVEIWSKHSNSKSYILI